MENAVQQLLSTIHSYLGGLGLRRLEDYIIELSMWVDAEIEGWGKPQIVVKLLENGLRKISEKELEFSLHRGCCSLGFITLFPSPCRLRELNHSLQGHGEFHWVPSSTSQLLIDFIVAPSN